MRPAIVLGCLTLAALAAIIFGDGPQGSFEDRFAKAERDMEAMARSIEDDLAPEPQNKPAGQ